MPTRDEYEEGLRSDLRRLERWMMKLELRAEEKQIGDDGELKAVLDDVRNQRDAFSSGLYGMQKAGTDEWEDLRRRTEEAWTELSAMIDGAVNRFEIH
ncbi:hypothetical protein HQ520_18750 [bacterium]|nr:hypothetical protein [bacterium]